MVTKAENNEYLSCSIYLPYLISLRHLRELLMCIWVTFIGIRMVFLGELKSDNWLMKQNSSHVLRAPVATTRALVLA